MMPRDPYIREKFTLAHSEARRVAEDSVEAVQDGRIYIKLINGPFLFAHGGSPA